MNDVYRRVLALRAQLWQLADAQLLDAPAGIDITEVMRQVDHHLHAAEGLLRTPAGPIQERCAPDAHPVRTPSDLDVEPAGQQTGSAGAQGVRTAHAQGVRKGGLTVAAAEDLARAVIAEGLSKQSITTLKTIYLAAAQGRNATSIGADIAMAHSTVIRALEAARKITGRPVTATDGEMFELANEVQRRGVGKRKQVDVVTAAAAAIVGGESTNAISQVTGLSHHTVNRIREVIDEIHAVEGVAIKLEKGSDR